MEDGKREAAVSMLPIIPEDSDSGRTYTCRVINPAAPAGRQTSVTINVQRESRINLSMKTLKLSHCSESACYKLGRRFSTVALLESNLILRHTLMSVT